MKLESRQMDRPIVIEQNGSSTQDSLGAIIPAWTTFHSCYAKWTPALGVEQQQAQGVHSADYGKFTFRYKSGVLPTMRVSFDGNYYKIISVTEIPRREGTEITVELWR